MTGMAVNTSNHLDVPSHEGPAYWVGNTEFVTLKLTGKETDGAFALLELVAMPGAEPPPHVHRTMDETYYLLAGELTVLHGERTSTASAGEVVYLPRGTLHAWRNASLCRRERCFSSANVAL